MKEHCPTCAVRFEREAGFFVGALFINFAATQVLLFVWLAISAALTLPTPSIPLMLSGAVVICIAVPIAFYPSSKTTWFAIHVAMEPLEPEEEAEAAATRFEWEQ